MNTGGTLRLGGLAHTLGGLSLIVPFIYDLAAPDPRGALLVTAGFVMFGIATLRAGRLPRWAAWLVILSAWFGLAAAFAPVPFHLGGIAFGLGNAGLGYAVWMGAGAAEMRPAQAG
jgi:hypothetical protein